MAKERNFDNTLFHTTRRNQIQTAKEIYSEALRVLVGDKDFKIIETKSISEKISLMAAAQKWIDNFWFD